jgi:hypothetical protein
MAREKVARGGIARGAGCAAHGQQDAPLQSLQLRDVGNRRGQKIPPGDDGELRHRGGGARREGEAQSHGIVFRLVERGKRFSKAQRQAAGKAPVNGMARAVYSLSLCRIRSKWSAVFK